MLAIVRINYRQLKEVPHDEERLLAEGINLKFEIPEVTVLRSTGQQEEYFDTRPLLFNYGFVDIPKEYTQNPTTLRRIAQLSTVITGWFYRRKEEVDREIESMKAEGLKLIPRWVEIITPDQLALLNAEAQKKEIYIGTDELVPGSFVILQKRPFHGLAAEVIEILSGDRVKVILLDSGVVLVLSKANVLYTPYSEEEAFEDR
jgi:hypothetical protein